MLLKGPIGLALPARRRRGLPAAGGALAGASGSGARGGALLGELGLWWGLPLVLLVCVPVFVWLEIRLGRVRSSTTSSGCTTSSAAWAARGCAAIPGGCTSPICCSTCCPTARCCSRRSGGGCGATTRWRASGWRGCSASWCCCRRRASSGPTTCCRRTPERPCSWAASSRAGAGRPRCVGVVAAAMLAGWVVRIGHQLAREERYRDYRPFAPLVREHAPPPDEVIFFRGEAHALAFRVGRPLAVVVEWPVCASASRGDGCHVVMPRRRTADESPAAARRRRRAAGRHRGAGGRPARAAAGAAAAATDPTHHPIIMPELPKLPPIADQPLSVVLLAATAPITSATSLIAWLGVPRRRAAGPYELILVDDGSDDGTADGAGQRRRLPALRVIRLDQPQGEGAALRAGLEAATKPLVFYTLCDPAYRPEMLGAPAGRGRCTLDEGGEVQGDRPRPPDDRLPRRRAGCRWGCAAGLAVAGAAASCCSAYSPRRRRAGWACGDISAGCWSRVLFGLRHHDVACPFRLMRRDILARIPIQSNGPFAHVELLAKANFLGCLMGEEMPLDVKPPPYRGDAGQFFRDGQKVFNKPDFGPAILPSPEPTLPG